MCYVLRRKYYFHHFGEKTMFSVSSITSILSFSRGLLDKEEVEKITGVLTGNDDLLSTKTYGVSKINKLTFLNDPLLYMLYSNSHIIACLLAML